MVRHIVRLVVAIAAGALFSAGVLTPLASAASVGSAVPGLDDTVTPSAGSTSDPSAGATDPVPATSDPSAPATGPTAGSTTPAPGVTDPAPTAAPGEATPTSPTARLQAAASGTCTPDPTTGTVCPPTPTCVTDLTLCKPVALDKYATPAGARFNNALGNINGQRVNINHVIRTINSMPGYTPPAGRACPTDPSLIPGTIKISVYSMADRPFAAAMINAAKRCISVQFLMNSHLTRNAVPVFGDMQDYLGTDVNGKNFARNCCSDVGVLHTKFYLFDTNPDFAPVARAAGYRTQDHIVMVGSSNMTRNAGKRQWNDLYTATGYSGLYNDFASIFRSTALRQRAAQGLVIDNAGPFQMSFYPQAGGNASNDRVINALNQVRCNNAGSAGVNGKTVIYLNMHAWSGTRGKYIAAKVRQLFNQGCYFRILYSYLGKGTYNYLAQSRGPRMVLRRTLFGNAKTGYATVYSHLKNIDIAGNINGQPNSYVAYTGSANFSDRTLRADEVMIRIPIAGVYRQYVRQWNHIRNRKSAATWAYYAEPTVTDPGGRAARASASPADDPQIVPRVPNPATPDFMPAD